MKWSLWYSVLRLTNNFTGMARSAKLSNIFLETGPVEMIQYLMEGFVDAQMTSQWSFMYDAEYLRTLRFRYYDLVLHSPLQVSSNI